jgi:ABC-type uncharacterized transport system fused permease/ATPase subunit
MRRITGAEATIRCCIPFDPRLVHSDYYQSKLALEWREWMTRRFTADYFADRTFYQVQVGGQPGDSVPSFRTDRISAVAGREGVPSNRQHL